MSDDSPSAQEADSRPLLEVLEDALPVKRRIDIEGWPRPVWVWRLELADIMSLNRKRHMLAENDDRAFQEWGVELLVMCLGDENAPGAFRSANGRSWLRRQAEAVANLITIAREFNELGVVSPERKKKSASQESELSLPSASEST